jgi:preprotein translocase subunit YajC
MDHVSSEFLLLAQQGKAAASPNDGAFQWIMMGVIAMLFYVIVMRPGSQAEKKRKELLRQLKKGDKVVTSAGIFGTVVSVDEEKVVIRVDDDKGVRLTMRKAGVAEVITPAVEKSGESKPVPEVA